jgi:8-oxo-dGTP pyrophosphatase MutT (NUDIX family)
MDAPSLERVPDLAFARRVLVEYAAPDARQAALRQRFLDFIDAHPHDAHDRACAPGHLTASVLLLDHERARVLLHHHRKLARWLQSGGHCDGDANLYACARRELLEESGIAPAWQSARPFDLDAHVIPARGREAEHVHWDVRYLAVAPPGARAVRSDESRALRWFTPGEARAERLDASLGRLLALAFP